MRRSLAVYGIIIFIIVLDRVTKWWAIVECATKSITINSFLSFSLAYNRGMAWSLAASDDKYIFSLVTSLVIFITLWIIYCTYRRYTTQRNILGESILIAGSIGNIYDRLVAGGVVDFIELSYAQWCWPIFNVADIAIVVGVGIMMYSQSKENDEGVE